MFLPYTQQAALAQLPILFDLLGNDVLLYPLRLRSILEINEYIRTRYARKKAEGSEFLDGEMKSLVINKVITETEDINFHHGVGYKFITHDIDSMVYLVRHLLRFHNDWGEDRIKSILFPSDVITDASVSIVLFMQMAVHKDPPPIPKLNVAEKERKYEWTDEERIAHIYYTFANKFHWTYEQVLDLTEYQVVWYTYLFPDERQHIEELDEMAQRSKQSSTGQSDLDVPYQPNTRHFNSPEEYEAWLASQPPKQKDG